MRIEREIVQPYPPHTLPYNPETIAPKPSAVIEAVQEAKKPQPAGMLSNLYNWFKNLFSETPGETEKGAPPTIVEQDRISKHMHQISQLQAHHKDMLDDTFDPLALATEIGLEKAWVKAQIDQIKIRENQIELNQEELKQIHEAIQKIKGKIDELMAKENENGRKAVIFGNLEVASCALIVATLIVFSSVSLASALTSGAAIGPGLAASLPAIKVTAEALGMLAGGASALAKSVYKFKANSYDAKILGARHKRQVGYSKSDDLIDRMKEASEAVTAGYKNAAELEKKKNEAIRSF